METYLADKTQVVSVDTDGKQVGIIFSGVLAKGKHRLALTDKINNLAAGMYLLKVQAKNQTGLVKLIVQ